MCSILHMYRMYGRQEQQTRSTHYFVWNLKAATKAHTQYA
jgi:hypothetical protein